MAIEPIRLSDGTLVTVDDEDFEWAAQQRWSRSAASGKRQGYAAHGGTTNGRRWLRYMHREIAVRAGVLTSYDDPRWVDHVDRNAWNNSRANLRAVTRGENNANCWPRTPSGFVGVYQYRPGQWSAEAQREGKKRRLYGFTSAEAAAAARAELADGH